MVYLCRGGDGLPLQGWRRFTFAGVEMVYLCGGGDGLPLQGWRWFTFAGVEMVSCCSCPTRDSGIKREA